MFFFTDGRIVPEILRRRNDLKEMNPEHPLRSLVLGCLQSLPEDRPTAVKLVITLTNFKEGNIFYRFERVNTSGFDYEFKVVLLGDRQVGNTSITTKFVRPQLPFQHRLPMTITYGQYNWRFKLEGTSILPASHC